jgi:hypothetical protein
MFVDMMPPPAFTLVPNVGWVPTVELTVQVRGKPAPGPILCRARSTTLMNGVTELDCEIWDATGALGRTWAPNHESSLNELSYQVATCPPGRLGSA